MDKKVLVNSIKDNVKQFYTKKIEEASLQEIYQATAYAVRDLIMDDWIDSTSAIKNKKIVYYMSMEFLIGRMLGNNIISLMSHKLVSEALEELGVDLTKLEEEERDPALGNGGLGRLAACFLDSLSTMGYPAIGCGIRYKYGMFRQLIKMVNRLRYLTVGLNMVILLKLKEVIYHLKSNLVEMLDMKEMRRKRAFHSRKLQCNKGCGIRYSCNWIWQ